MDQTQWKYQKTENDCWICALQNTLMAVGRNLSQNGLWRILEQRGLAAYEHRGFFPYLAVALDALEIPCRLVLCPANPLLSCILEKERSCLSSEKLHETIKTLFDQQNALYFFYESMRIAVDSPFVDVTIGGPPPLYYLNRGSIVIACLFASDLYGTELDQVLHTVTVRKFNNKLNLIDPYDKKGEKQEEDWSKLKEKSQMFNWSAEIPYYLALY